jgi:hypothetical protein
MATTAAIATQHQLSAGTVRTPLPMTGVDGTLVAANDVDQLVVAAINTLDHEEGRKEPAAAHSRSPSSMCTPPSAHVPHQARVLPSIATADPCDEFIRHRWGKDSRITIERHHERHRNVKGHNVE